MFGRNTLGCCSILKQEAYGNFIADLEENEKKAAKSLPDKKGTSPFKTLRRAQKPTFDISYTERDKGLEKEIERPKQRETDGNSGSELVDEINDTDLNDEKFPHVSYSFEEQLLAEQLYNSASVDYEQLFYGEDENKSTAKAKSEDEYWASTAVSDTEAEIMTTEEAEESFMNFQYKTVFGTPYDINGSERRKLDLHFKFNPQAKMMFEALHALTRDVNYGPLT